PSEAESAVPARKRAARRLRTRRRTGRAIVGSTPGACLTVGRLFPPSRADGHSTRVPARAPPPPTSVPERSSSRAPTSARDMLDLPLVSAARLASLATGRGGMPTGDEWPVVGALLLLVALVGARLLRTAGLSTTEAVVLAAGAPCLVL